MNKLVFPEMFLSTLRTIAMNEDELYQVSTLLEEVLVSASRHLVSLSTYYFSIYISYMEKLSS